MNVIRGKRSLKELFSQLQKLEGEADAERIALSNLQNQVNMKNRAIQSLKDRIRELEAPVMPRISEHALFRYCERVLAINMKEIETEVFQEPVVTMLKTLGSFKYTHPIKGYTVVFKNNVAVTIE